MKALQTLLCNEMHQGALKKRNYTLDNPLSINQINDKNEHVEKEYFSKKINF